MDLTRVWGDTRGVLRAIGGTAWANGAALPPQEHLFAGGPVTAPGYAFHAFTSARLLSIQSEWHLPVPFPSISLGRWGRIPGQASIVPFGSVVYTARPSDFRNVASGWYPSLGVAFTGLFDLLRIDVARGLRASNALPGGRWRFNVDVSREFWRIL
jgi:hypothetical protein